MLASVSNSALSISAAPTVEQLERLESHLLQMPQADIKTFHKFLPGIYERTIVIPPWTVLTGAVHKTPYRVRLESGAIIVNTNEGIKQLNGPCEFEAQAGVKRAGRVLNDFVIWTDVYSNEDNCTDIETLERRLYELDNCELGENKIKRLANQANEDFKLFLAQLGTDEERIGSIVQIDSDLIPMPDGYQVKLGPSRIHGIGMFAAKRFAAGEIICPGRLSGRRTPAGRFINHSVDINAIPHRIDNGDIWAIAVKDIQENEEILINYRDSMYVNFGIALEGKNI